MQEATRTNKIITRIEANPLLSNKENDNRQLRVAAYCRVSTDSEEQLESYEAQMSYYTDAIAKNPKWRFAGIYADEGVSGRKLIKKRPQLQRMLIDAQKNMFDLIIFIKLDRVFLNTL